MVEEAGPDLVILDQTDLRLARPDGIFTCIADQLRFSSGAIPYVVGVLASNDDGDLRLGQWDDVRVGERLVRFLPVARLKRDGPMSRLPDSLQLAIGLVRFRKRWRHLDAVFQVHHVAPGWLLGTPFMGAKRLVQFIHNDSTGLLGGESDSFWARVPKIYRILERQALTRASKVVLFNKTDAPRLREFRADVMVKQTGYRDDLISSHKPPRDGRPLSVIWVGRFDRQKRPHLALQCAAELKNRGVPFHLTFIGSGPLGGEMRNHIDAHGLRSNTTLLDPLPREQVYAQMARADALLMTSAYEGSPTVLVEANANGTPVVATSGSDPDGQIREGVNGFVVVAEEAVAKLVDGLMAARELRSEDCRVAVEHRSAKKLARELTAIR